MSDFTNEQRQMRRRFIRQQIITTVLFLLGMISCYIGAIQEIPWLGPCVVGVIAVFHLAFEKDRWRELQLILAVGVIAFMMESILITVGIYTITPSTRWVFPAPLCSEWLLALWINFGVKIKNILPMIKGRHILNTITGFIFGVLIFGSAATRGILSLEHGMLSLVIIAVLWAILTPLLFLFAARFLGSATLQSGVTEKK